MMDSVMEGSGAATLTTTHRALLCFALHGKGRCQPKRALLYLHCGAVDSERWMAKGKRDIDRQLLTGEWICSVRAALGLNTAASCICSATLSTGQKESEYF